MSHPGRVQEVKSALKMMVNVDLAEDAESYMSADDNVNDNDATSQVKIFEGVAADHSVPSVPETLEPQSGDLGMERKGVVIFLGKTVAGKTTLCKLLAGGHYEARLSAEERENVLLIVDDDGLIGQDGTSTTRDPTFYSCTPLAVADVPDAVRDHQDDDDDDDPDCVHLCDCAGFGDTRGADAEVAQLRQLRGIALDAAVLKVALVVEYASVVGGTCLDSFMGLLEYAVQLLTGDRYFAAVALVVTKVSNDTRRANGQFVLKGDDEVLEGVLAFLRHVEDALRQDDGRLAYLAEDVRERSAELVAVLASGGKRRVALMRRPAEPGPVADCELLQQGKRAVQRLLLSRGGGVRWVRALSDDLGFPLSPTAHNGVSQQVQALLTEIPELVSAMVPDMKRRYQSLLAPLPVADALQLLRDHTQCLGETTGDVCPLCFGDPTIKDHIDNISVRLGALRALQDVYAEDIMSPMLRLRQEMKDTLRDYLYIWGLFFDFLERLAEYVWSYDVQSHQGHFDVDDVADWGKDRADEEKVTGIEVTTDNIRTLLGALQQSGAMQAMDFAELEFEEPMLVRVNSLLREALRHEPVVTHNAFGAVVVQGLCLVLSKVLARIQELEQYSSLTLYARGTVYLDRDLHAEGWRLKLAVVAPRWVVVNHPKFYLCGQPGSVHPCPRVPRPSPDSDDLAGAPGLPGGSGGSFLGAFVECVNSAALEISVSGGNGGPGADGREGVAGEDGADARPAFYSQSSQHSLGDRSVIVTMVYNQHSRKFLGFPGKEGGHGGDGGCGGRGGLPGEVHILIPDQSCFDGRISKKGGKCGSPGKGGAGGLGGRFGKNFIGAQHFLFFIPVGVSTKVEDIEERRAQSGASGTKGKNQRGMEPPVKAATFSDKSSILEQFLQMQHEYSVSHFPCSQQQLQKRFNMLLSEQLKTTSSKWVCKESLSGLVSRLRDHKIARTSEKVLENRN